MRKMIETSSTLALWAVWLIGSGFAVAEFVLSPIIHQKIIQHLWIISWAPGLATFLFTAMMLAIRHSSDPTEKKTIPSQHTVQWTPEDFTNAQTGKIIDLQFPGSGLDCKVQVRSEVAQVLHKESQGQIDPLLSEIPDETVAGIFQEAF